MVFSLFQNIDGKFKRSNQMALTQFLKKLSWKRTLVGFGSYLGPYVLRVAHSLINKMTCLYFLYEMILAAVRLFVEQGLGRRCNRGV